MFGTKRAKKFAESGSLTFQNELIKKDRGRRVSKESHSKSEAIRR